MKRHGIKLAVSLVIAGAFAWTMHRGGLPLLPPADALARVNPSGVVVYFLLLVVLHTFRATRWRHLLAPIAKIPLKRVLSVSFIGFAAILLMPLRAGEIVRPYLIRKRSHISMAAATGTIGAERVIDGLMVTSILGICLQIAKPLSPLPNHIGKLDIPVAAVPLYAYVSLIGFFTAFALMGIFFVRPQWGRALVFATVGIVSKPLATRMANFVERTADGLKFLPSLSHFAPFLLESAIYWACNAWSLQLLARACGIHDIGFAQACVVMGVLGVGILVPAGPGLFGAFQASIYAGLAMYFPDDIVLGPGAAFVFLVYAVQFVWHMLTGAAGLLMDRESAEDVVEPGPEIA